MNEDYLKLYLENKDSIPFKNFVLLVLVYQNEEEILDTLYETDYMDFSTNLNLLESQGYVKWHGDRGRDISLRKKGEDLFSKLSKRKKNIPDPKFWIEEWRKIFPEGVNTAGYRYRGNRLEVLKKMTKFVALYDFSKEEIFEATRKYVERFSVRGYNYMQQAHYFIEKKDAGSSLASECETLRENKSKPQKEETSYGRTII